jgi:protocatechuate 3,4-dioxygenase beta subunit
VTVELLSDQGSVATVQTSRQGTYRFRNIAPGNYSVSAGGQKKKVYVGPGVNRFNIDK